MKDRFDARDCQTLLAESARPCVSLYLPTHAAGAEGQQDIPRLKNLLSKAEADLTPRLLRSSEARELLDPVRDLLADAEFWRTRSRGLAVFAAPGRFQRFRVPIELDELVVVNDRYHVKPLLPLVSDNQRFFVLVLNQQHPRLFEGSQFDLSEVVVKGMPGELKQALHLDEAARSGPDHPASRGHGRSVAGFHGHGVQHDVAKDELVQYLRLVDHAVQSVLHEERAPLVLAGVEYVLPLYRSVTRYSHVLAAEIHGNCDHRSPQDLHDQAWPLVEAAARKTRQDAGAKFRQLVGSGRAGHDLRDVVPAAQQGRVETLFVSRRAQRWGRFVPEAGFVDVHGQPQPGDYDLLDLAAAATLMHRGTVYAVDADELPADSPVAAVYRY